MSLEKDKPTSNSLNGPLNGILNLESNYKLSKTKKKKNKNFYPLR